MKKIKVIESEKDELNKQITILNTEINDLKENLSEKDDEITKLKSKLKPWKHPWTRPLSSPGLHFINTLLLFVVCNVRNPGSPGNPEVELEFTVAILQQSYNWIIGSVDGSVASVKK